MGVKPHHHIVASAEPASTRQMLFVRYLLAILIDLVVLNLLAEFWDRVYVESFSFSLLVAVLLQVLMQGTLVLEHRVAGFFEGRSGGVWLSLRLFSAWLILFSSKFVMLAAISFVVGDAVRFTGALHGAVPFIAVIMLMIGAEEVVARVHRTLS